MVSIMVSISDEGFGVSFGAGSDSESSDSESLSGGASTSLHQLRPSSLMSSRVISRLCSCDLGISNTVALELTSVVGTANVLAFAMACEVALLARDPIS